jgi:hypothetical protein
MPVAQPYTAPGCLSPQDAGDLASRARRALRRGLLTHRELVLFECLLWQCRRHGQDAACVSYNRLCDLAHVSRGVVAAGLRRLGQLGLVAVIKRRIRVVWGGGVASRQGTNTYRFSAQRTEFTPPTVIEEMKIIPSAADPDRVAAQQALARRRETIAARLAAQVLR